MRMTVAELMSEIPVTVKSNCTTDAALDAFYEYETPELYVVDDSGRLLGVLPDYELLKAQISGEAKGMTVDALMSRSVPFVRPETDAANVASLFRECQCQRLPVLKGTRLVGVVTRQDVLRLMAVLRRIESQSAGVPARTKVPKATPQAKPATTRTARAKSTTPASMNRRRSKQPARR